MYWKYLKYLLRHKWYVSIECFRNGLIWRGLKHDLSKFRPGEFLPYAKFFYGPKDGDINTGRDSSGYYSPGVTRDEAFNFAWLLHQKRNDHHWQWWWLKRDDGEQRCFPMSERSIDEMLCDWVGAGRAIKRVHPPRNDRYREARSWYHKNKDKILLHEKTRDRVETILGPTVRDN